MSNETKKVAIVGAGINGVVSGKHLLASGCSISIFERSAGYGGVWTYDDRRSLEPTYPALKPYQAGLPLEVLREVLREVDNEEKLDRRDNADLIFAPPGPCYESLMNNVATPLVQITNQPWPEGTENFVNHSIINQYIVEAARLSGLGKFTHFNTAIERISKQDNRWIVTSRTMTRDKNDKPSFLTSVDHFDAVVVASGHYHTARIPDIPGLKEWKSAYPSRIHHSKSYRRARDYKDKSVLLIGAGTSSFDIAREIGLVAKDVYQSARGGSFDLPIDFLTLDARRVAGVSHFRIEGGEAATHYRTGQPMSEEQPIPFDVHLQDGTILFSIHHVILCTGYHCTVPFLPHLHNDSLTPEEAPAFPDILVTDGTQFHNLHKDIFYIPDPTVAFVGIPYYTATFTLFEFQAIAVAAVFAGYADLPSGADMRAEYEDRVARKGYGRGFHSLRDRDIEYADELLIWINAEGAKRGRDLVLGHTEEFKMVFQHRRDLMGEMIKERNKRARVNQQKQ